jgi:hypothetical protein
MTERMMNDFEEMKGPRLGSCPHESRGTFICGVLV